MKWTKNFVPFCLLVILTIVFVGVLVQFTYQQEEMAFATDYEQLQLFVEYTGGREEINIWQDAGNYYFFLPANVEGENVVFGNLRQGDSISVGDEVYYSTNNILDKIEFNVAYEIQMVVNGGVLAKQQLIFMKSENLPAIFIETETGTLEAVHEDKEVKEKASLVVVDEQGKREYGRDIEYIKARGNSTFLEVDKKSYQIKLSEKSPLLGMDEAKKWLLLANAKDASLMRNKLVFDFAKKYTDIPTIAGEYVDLYINGDYVGNYFLCEKVELGESRLEITDLEEMNETVNSESSMAAAQQYISEDGNIRAYLGLNNPLDITGGYLLEKIGEAEFSKAQAAFKTAEGNYYCVVSPQMATVEQVEYICNLFDELETAVGMADGIHPETGMHFSEYLDMDSWTSKYVMEEVFSDPDVPEASVFFYKEAGDSLIYSGPMWDYDRTMGGYAVNKYYLDDPLQMGYRGVYAEQLLQHEEVMEAVTEKYEEWFLPYLNKELAGEVYSLKEKLEASAAMNYVRWPEVIGYYEEWDANAEYILKFLEARKEYLNDVWLGKELYHKVTFLRPTGGISNEYVVKHGECLPEVPTPTSYVAIFDSWVSVATGQELDIRQPILEDAVYESKWLDIGLLLQNGLAADEVSLESIDVETLEALVEEIKRQRAE